MSASASPVASPRKSRHTRSKGQTVSQSVAGSSDFTSRFHAVQSALPPGVDPLTLDPDDAFVRLSVREIQTIEAGLRSSHDAMSGKLRTLVSERYRDMLGTANTLIEMSTSASNLVTRLDAVRQGIEMVGKDSEDRSGSEEQLVEEVSKSDKPQAKAAVFSAAAVTKLLAESPDEVWRAVDSASQRNMTSGAGKRDLVERELNNFKAATALRAAWIYTLCKEAWKWLSAVEGVEDPDMHALFPYIAKQWSALAPTDASIVGVSQAGLAGWPTMEADAGKRWQDVSTSYMATITFLLSIALLQPAQSITAARDVLLEARKASLQLLLKRGRTAPAQTLSRLIHCIAGTIIHTMRAFALVEHGATVPHLASILQGISSDIQQGTFPPRAFQVILTLPSAPVLIEHLPASVRNFAPRLRFDDALACQETTASALHTWSRSVLSEGAFAVTVEGLKTIASIGEAQSLLRETFDRCLVTAEKCGEKTVQSLTEVELREVLEMLERVLRQRLDSLCRDKAAELSTAVSQSTSAALRKLSDDVDGSRGARMEKNPTDFLFEGETTSSLQSRLRFQTPLVQSVLSCVEERAESLREEMEAYSAYIQRGISKRVRRREKKDRRAHAKALSDQQDEKTAQVVDTYHKQLDAARLAMVDELRSQLDWLSGEATVSTGSLLIARIASALEHSEKLRGDSKMAATSNEGLFVQQLVALRTLIVDRWLTRTATDAIHCYPVKVVSCLDPRQDAQCRPTSALIESLLCLVDGVHALGCGYLSEMAAASQQLLAAFVEAWIELSDKVEEKDRPCYTFDSSALATMLGEWDGNERLAARLDNISGGGIGTDKKLLLELALHRLRLVLLPLCQAHTLPDKRVPADSSSAPALPMLSIIKDREKVALL